ncbi:MBL fold metallo-hydrolase [Cellulosimicrobium sp. I38E]|uniref:MBL fold metallo-hydrolase n=1 Tax=Cellulosimicrobium sp. I38E TaxID=1393139 RepID=UPI000B24E948|nr:MBL fold metallo-hydrolase [Cellulosimicrobium sp. I38E]
MSDAASATLTFGGTATALLRFGRFTVLTDPNFLHRGQWAYLGKGLASRRRTEPAFGPTGLPPLDAVVLSHLHGDHFDRVARRGLTRQVPLLTTPSAARRLARHHFATVGMPTGAVETFRSGKETLDVESVPAIHARGALRALLPEVMGTGTRTVSTDGARPRSTSRATRSPGTTSTSSRARSRTWTRSSRTSGGRASSAGP